MVVQGIYPPVLTPFDESGALDERRLRTLAEFWAGHVHGMYVCGSYGSGPLMSPEERERVFEVLAETVGDRVGLIAHVGAIDTQTTLRLARHAEQHGAQAVAAVPPYYYTHNEAAICAHFEALLQAVSIPVYAYDNPKATGNPLSPALLDRLAELGLAGLKDSSFDISKLYMAMRVVRKPGFDFVIGSESLMLPAFVMGVRGCIAGLANPFPEVMRRFYEAAATGTPEDASRWQARVLKLWDLMHIDPSVSCAYALLSLRGFDAGFPRRPLLPLDAETMRRSREGLQALQVLWDGALG